MRKPSTLGLTFFLALISGVTWYAWSAHDFGRSCGFRLPGYPGGPTTAGAIILVSVPGIVVAAVHGMRTRSWLGALRYGALAAALAALAVGIAVLFWVGSRHCTE